MWIFLIMGFVFIVIGFAVHKLKWHFLISGYNTMSKERKKNVDTEGLGILMGRYSYANGGVYIIAGILYRLGSSTGLILAIGFTMVSTLYLLIKAQKYDGNKDRSKQSRIGIIILLVSFIFVGGIMYSSIRPIEVTLLEEGLEIHGMYGDVYPWDSIEEVTLIEELPTIKIRTNGSSLGSHLKGNFSTEELGAVKLHVNTQYPPFIKLEANGRKIIFNMTDRYDTEKLLDEILSKIQTGK